MCVDYEFNYHLIYTVHVEGGEGGREREEGRGGLLCTYIVHVYIVVGVYVCKW